MKKLFINILFAFSIVLVSNNTQAQYSDITYFMRSTPFAYKMNPAIMPTASMYINYPVLSGINVNFGTSGFAYNDLIKRRDDDSLMIDFKSFYDALSDRNYIRLDGNFEILGFGFNIGEKNYLSFGVDLNIDSRLSFSKDLFGFLSGERFSKNETIDIFTKDILSINSYLSTSIGYTRVINDKINVGGRLKLLFGIANVYSEESELTITQDNSGLTAQGNFLIRTSNLAGKIDFSGVNDSTNKDKFNLDSPINASNIFKNMGLGIDLGATYKLNDKMLFSFSIKDLGFINWTTNATNIVSKNPNGKYTFRGFENIATDSSFSNQLEQIGDSVIQALDVKTTEGEAYSTMLPTKVYIGYTWNFAKTQYLNALYKATIGNNYFDNHLSIFYSLQLERFLNVSLGNTFAFENNFHNIKPFNPSVALNFNVYALNLYVGSSLNSSYNVAKMTGVNFFFGINLALGYNDLLKQKDKDKNKDDESQIPEKSK
jgi:hypothetical protein